MFVKPDKIVDAKQEALYHGIANKKLRRLPPEIAKRILNKPDMINGAHDILDLRSPPGNRLEALVGDLAKVRQWAVIGHSPLGFHGLGLFAKQGLVAFAANQGEILIAT